MKGPPPWPAWDNPGSVRVTTSMDENTWGAFASVRSRRDTNNESLLEDSGELAHCFETGKLRERKEHLSCQFRHRLYGRVTK